MCLLNTEGKSKKSVGSVSVPLLWGDGDDTVKRLVSALHVLERRLASTAHSENKSMAALLFQPIDLLKRCAKLGFLEHDPGRQDEQVSARVRVGERGRVGGGQLVVLATKECHSMLCIRRHATEEAQGQRSAEQDRSNQQTRQTHCHPGREQGAANSQRTQHQHEVETSTWASPKR